MPEDTLTVIYTPSTHCAHRFLPPPHSLPMMLGAAALSFLAPERQIFEPEVKVFNQSTSSWAVLSKPSPVRPDFPPQIPP